VKPKVGIKTGIRKGKEMAINALKIDGLKPKAKPYKVADGNRLELHVAVSGKKTWRLRYDLAVGDEKKERAATLGTYPEMSLQAARDAASATRKQIAAGADPVFEKKVSKQRKAHARLNTYAACLDELIDLKRAEGISEASITHIKRCQRNHVLSYIGHYPMADLTMVVLCALVKQIRENVPGSVRPIAGQIREVCSLATRRGLIPHNIATEIHKEAPQQEAEARPALLDPEKVGVLINEIKRLEFDQRVPMMMCAYLYTRAAELMKAAWTEFNLDKAMWVIPAPRMKQRRAHAVPLPKQAVKMLRELKLRCGTSPWVFPNVYRKGMPSGKDRLSGIMHRYLRDYDGIHVPHGFRATASHTLGETFFNGQVIEMSLSHKVGKDVELVYKRPEWINYQRIMRQAYADYLDDIGNGMDGVKARQKLQAVEPLAKAA
jgi:integrase